MKVYRFQRGRAGAGRSSCTHTRLASRRRQKRDFQGRNTRPALTPCVADGGDLDLRGSCRAGVASSLSPSSRGRVPSSSYLVSPPPPLDSIYLAPPVTNGVSGPIPLLQRDSLATSGMHPVIEGDGLGNQKRRRRSYIRSCDARDEPPKSFRMCPRGVLRISRGSKTFLLILQGKCSRFHCCAFVLSYLSYRARVFFFFQSFSFVPLSLSSSRGIRRKVPIPRDHLLLNILGSSQRILHLSKLALFFCKPPALSRFFFPPLEVQSRSSHTPPSSPFLIAHSTILMVLSSASASWPMYRCIILYFYLPRSIDCLELLPAT